MVLIGMEDEVAVAREVERAAGEGVVNLAGQTKLPELIALVAGAHCAVMHDSGPMHLATALGPPDGGHLRADQPSADRPVPPPGSGRPAGPAVFALLYQTSGRLPLRPPVHAGPLPGCYHGQTPVIMLAGSEGFVSKRLATVLPVLLLPPRGQRTDYARSRRAPVLVTSAGDYNAERQLVTLGVGRDGGVSIGDRFWLFNQDNITGTGSVYLVAPTQSVGRLSFTGKGIGGKQSAAVLVGASLPSLRLQR